MLSKGKEKKKKKHISDIFRFFGLVMKSEFDSLGGAVRLRGFLVWPASAVLHHAYVARVLDFREKEKKKRKKKSSAVPLNSWRRGWMSRPSLHQRPRSGIRKLQMMYEVQSLPAVHPCLKVFLPEKKE